MSSKPEPMDLSLRCGHCGFQPADQAALGEICMVCGMDGYRLLPNNTVMAYFQVLRESAAPAPPASEETPPPKLMCGHCRYQPAMHAAHLGEICGRCGVDGYRLVIQPHTPPLDAGGATATIYDSCWPPRDVVQTLADAADHLMKDHDCDQHGWERVGFAVKVARAFLAEPVSVAGDLPGVGRPVRDYMEGDPSRDDNWRCECGRFCHAESVDLRSEVDRLRLQAAATAQLLTIESGQSFHDSTDWQAEYGRLLDSLKSLTAAAQRTTG